MLINPEEINKSLSTKGWIYKNKNIIKSFEFTSYMEGIEFVQKIAQLAEQYNHHPEIKIKWCKVKISITSHELDGVTTKCVNLATKLDLIYASFS